jgi:hypothetical protein
MDRGETDHSSRAGAVSTGPSALDRSTSTVRSPVRSHDFVASQHAIPRRHHCRRLRASNCKKQVPASAAGAAGGQCGAPTAAPSAQDAAHHRRPSIEPGRTGAQRTSRRARAARARFSTTPSFRSAWHASGAGSAAVRAAETLRWFWARSESCVCRLGRRSTPHEAASNAERADRVLFCRFRASQSHGAESAR